MQFVSRYKEAAITGSRWILLSLSLGTVTAKSANHLPTVHQAPAFGMNEKLRIHSERDYVVQLAAHRYLPNAQRALDAFNAPEADIVKITDADGVMYLVISGSYADRRAAESAAKLFSLDNPQANYWLRPAQDLIFLLGDSYQPKAVPEASRSQLAPSPEVTSERGDYTVQLSADRNRFNSEQKLSTLHAPNAEIVKIRDSEGDLYLLLSGQYADDYEAREAAEKLAMDNPSLSYWVRKFTEWPERKQPTPPEEKTTTAVARVEHSLARDAKPRPRPKTANEKVSIKLDEIWGEYGYFSDRQSAADHQGYVSSHATANWLPNEHWEIQLSGRVDGYYQWGEQDSQRFEADYGETFIRYNSDDLRLTLGAQKIVWGRIDEFPPIDRLSTQDLSRFVLDELADRRRAGAALRLEYFSDIGKIDFVYLPYFRAAELPEEDSIWFPIDQTRGEVFGLRPTAFTSALIKSATVDLNEPSSDGGAGVRYTGMIANSDFGLSIQRVRHNIPYFTYNAATSVIGDAYPRSWVAGADIGLEALNGVVRFELAWLSDTPVTSPQGELSTVESINWGGSYEFFPGDGDARINIQLMGNTLFNRERVLDRTEDYSLSGSFETPFSHNMWRFNTRFYLGLRDSDWYLNPELAYIGRPSQEFYIEAHYFDGDDGTPGGFHKNNSMISTGWRIKF